MTRAFATLAGVISLGFGGWHFFVPSIWDWNQHIRPEATELVVAVRAINVFFSLCLVLLGGLSIAFAWAPRSDAYFTRSLWVAMSVLWGTRVGMQIVYPQGSASPVLQYSMLATFTVTFALYVATLFMPQR